MSLEHDVNRIWFHNRYNRHRHSLSCSNCYKKRNIQANSSLYWSIMILIIINIIIGCLHPFASECHRIGTNQLCELCGADTFACGQSFLLANWSSNALWNSSNNNQTRSSSLNVKVQQMLLKLNSQRNAQVINGSSTLSSSSFSANCTCIPIAWHCDSEIDCLDASDEIGCDKPSCPSQTNFSCATNSKCIPKSLFCDGNDDCGDNSDEIDCTARQCDIKSETRCDNGRCIPSEWLCDLHDDCHDMSDERCINKCSQDEFQCNSGQCIPLIDHCNSLDDCDDHSDELHCNGKLSNVTTTTLATVNGNIENSHISCPANQFMCNNGLCIPESSLCDDDNDCGNWEDETNCDVVNMNQNDRTKATHLCHFENEFQCHSGQCIPLNEHCNGEENCEDKSDEINCDQVCENGQFRCNSGRCIESTDRCDGSADCDDNSDEQGCTNRAECASGNFRCRDGTCIGLPFVCNGAPNCPDGSDESSSICIAGVAPCHEQGFPCQQLCVATNSGHFCSCKHGYRKGSDGRSCIDIDECQVGSQFSAFELDPLELIHHQHPHSTDAKLNGAQLEVQMCSQLCENSVPGFQCSCADGYRLLDDRRRCKAIETVETILIASKGDHFSSIALTDSLNQFEKSSYNSKLPSMENGEHRKPMIMFDYDYVKSAIFWNNPSTRTIYSALIELPHLSLTSKLFHSNRLHQPKAIIQSGLIEPTGIAVDWINHKLFFADFGNARIEFCNYDGSMRKVLFHKRVHKPHSIVVDPIQSRVLWSDWGDSPRIETSFMDGTSRQVIISSFLSMPTGLTLDYPSNKLYWIDTKQNMIECSNMDGSNRFQFITNDDIHRPISLTMFEDYLYYSSTDQSIKLLNKLTGKSDHTIEFNLDGAFIDSDESYHEYDLQLKLYHPLRQPLNEEEEEEEKVVHDNHLSTSIRKPCQPNPCSHICLPNNSTYRCSCPFGFSLETNNQRKCQSNSNPMLMYTHRNDIRAITVSKRRFIPETDILQSDFNLAYVVPIYGISFVVSLDYDPPSLTLVWCDLVNKSLGTAQWSSATSSTLHQEVIVSDSLESPSGVAYDWAGNNLYFTDMGRNVIEVIKTNGSWRSLLVWRSLDQPRDIVLDPEVSFMFWTQWTNQSATIERASMDGSYRIILHSSNLTRPQCLALDHANRQLYWTDSGRGVIDSSSYDGSNRRLIIAKTGAPQHPFALAIFDDFVYWTDLQQRNVQRAGKINGEMHSIVFEDVDGLMDLIVFQYNRTLKPRSLERPNPCAPINSKCSHLCLLTPHHPGYRCACPTGIVLLPDGHQCADDMEKYLIFTTRNAIRRISLQSEHHFDVNLVMEQPMFNAYVVDVHTQTKTVFWSDTIENVIYSGNILTGKTIPIVRFGLVAVNGLAIDQIGHKMYFSDAGRKRIEVANLDGTYRRVLISQDLDSPRAIAVDHKSGFMVWTDWGSQVRIERSDMDGGRRAILVDQNLGWPNGITITKSGQIIWSDSKMHTIEMVDLNGANRRRLADQLPSPYGVAVMDNYLYFTDWHTKTINRIDIGLDHGQFVGSITKPEIFARSLTNLVDIRVVDQEDDRQFYSMQHNMCQVNNGGCSHLCLRNSAPGYSCHCPTGITLLDDEKSCQSEIPNQLLLACKFNIRRVSLARSSETFDTNDIFLPVDNLMNVVAIDYHFISGKIFYIDGTLRQIRSISLPDGQDLSQLVKLETNTNSLKIRTIISSDLSQPSSLAVDWIASNLYWSDKERHLIEVARLDGSSRKVLIDLDLDQPKCLVLLPNFGLMFWLNVGSVQRIERAFLDGSGRMTLVHQDTGQLNGITIDRIVEDHRNRLPRIYWTDGILQRIESIRIDGTDRRVDLSKGLTLPFSIAIHDEFVYWTDSFNKVVERANRWNGGGDYRLISDNIDMLQEIKIISKSKQLTNNVTNNRTTMNPCIIENGACSHLCLFRPHGYICACPSYPELRPCSTIPGEVISIDVINSTVEPVDRFKTNQSIVVKNELTTFNIGNGLDQLNEIVNESSSHESMCQDRNSNLTRCDWTSSFTFDDHIIQVAYAIALILLSLTILICAILAFICKRKLTEEESKITKLETNRNNRNQIVNLSSNHTNNHNNSNNNQSPFLSMMDLPPFNNSSAYSLEQNAQLVVPPPPPPPHCVHSFFHDDKQTIRNFDPQWLSSTKLNGFAGHHHHQQARQLADLRVASRMSQSSRRSQTLPRNLSNPTNMNPYPSPHYNVNNQRPIGIHSALNSPYLANKSLYHNHNSNSIPMPYLCLETSKLETDI